MKLDFPQDTTTSHKVYALARAIRTMKDPKAYTSRLINADGKRVYRIVFDEESPRTPLDTLDKSVA